MVTIPYLGVTLVLITIMALSVFTMVTFERRIPHIWRDPPSYNIYDGNSWQLIPINSNRPDAAESMRVTDENMSQDMQMQPQSLRLMVVTDDKGLALLQSNDFNQKPINKSTINKVPV